MRINGKLLIMGILLFTIIIGTATAAFVVHYATLTGTGIISGGVSVSDINNDPIPIGGSGVLEFDCNLASFTINNEGTEAVPVIIETNVTVIDRTECNYESWHCECSHGSEGKQYPNGNWCKDYWSGLDGLYLDYSIFDNNVSYMNDKCSSYIEEGIVIVPPDGLPVTLQFTTHPLVCPATYEIEVEVNPVLA